MLTLALLLQLSPDVIVTGKRLQEAQSACVRGECTVLLDVQTSIALAEVEFRNGEYLHAKRLLSDAVARNKAHAQSDPKPVAALYEALSTVALHDGDRDVYRRAVAGRVHTLRENLPADDPAVAGVAGALGDMWIKLGQYRQAQASFRAVEADARRTGNARQALIAGMKQAWLTAALGQRTRAERMIDELSAQPLAAQPVYHQVLDVLRLRIAARFASDAEMAALVRDLGRRQGETPTLIWAPPFGVDAVTAANRESRKFTLIDAIPVRSSDLDGLQWIDVGFWVRPDGRTAEMEVLRGSPSHDWDDVVLNQIAARRYTATQGMTGDAAEVGGSYRIERITRGSAYVMPGDSNISRRVATSDFQTLDLTEPTRVPVS